MCLERLEQQALAGRPAGANPPATLFCCVHGLTKTVDGDISTCVSVAEDSQAWPLVTSTNDNCLSSDCPLYKDCFVVKARKKAMDADVVVVNHHLFLADMVVKESGFAEADSRSGSDDLRRSASATGYRQPVLWAIALQPPAAGPGERYHDCLSYRAQRHPAAAEVRRPTGPERAGFSPAAREPGYRGNLRELLADHNIQRALLLLDDALELCYDVAKLSLGRSALLMPPLSGQPFIAAAWKRLKTSQPGFSYWYECTSRTFTLALTPLTVADKFKEVMAQKSGSWIFTSATLSVNDDLRHFTDRLGIGEAQTLLLPSPVDYAHQALLCVPRNLPLPNQPGAARHLAAMLKPLIEANDGRCFLCCALPRHDARSGGAVSAPP